MFECLIFGDSIGVGVGQAVNAAYIRQCDVLAQERAGTGVMRTWRQPTKIYGTTILSAGSNDGAGPRLSGDLFALRRSLSSRRVIWLLPYSREQAYLVASAAATFGDETLDLAIFSTADRIHPSSYKAVSDVLLRPATVGVSFSE